MENENSGKLSAAGSRDGHKGRRKGLETISPELLRRLKEGDHIAFQSVYLQSIDSMRNFLNLLLNNRDEAEDLAQEVFVSLWERHSQINPDKNFKAYLCTVTKWAAYNFLDHKKVKQKYHDFVMDFCSEYDHAPDDMVMGEELAFMVQVCLERMPEKQRKVFELSRLEGKTNEEIASMLKMSRGAVRVHLHGALSRIKDLISIFIVLFLP